MTLEYHCAESAAYISTLLAVGSGKSRAGASIAAFPMCENHTQVVLQIDRELMEEGWASTYMGKSPARIL